MITLELQPSPAPKEIAEMRATTAGKKIPSPVQSKRTRPSGRGYGHQQDCGHGAEEPKGTFTKKMRRQPQPRGAARRSSDPERVPEPGLTRSPMARPSYRPGTTSTMMAKLFACNIASPMACSARKPRAPARSGASPQSADAKVKIKKP